MISHVQAVGHFIHCIKVTAKKMYGIELSAKVVMIDHSDPLKLGFRLVYPEADLATDWPHIARKVKETR